MLNRSFVGHLPWWTLGLAMLAIGTGAVLGMGVSVLNSPIYAVAGALGAIVVLICIINPRVGLYILITITYLRLSDVLIKHHGAPSIAQPFVALMIGLTLLRWWYHEAPPKGTVKVSLLVMAYGLVTFLSVFYASDFDAVRKALNDFWKNAVIAIIVVMLLTDKNALRNVIWSLIAAGIFMGSISVWQYLTGTFDNNYWGFGLARIQNIAGASGGYRIAGPIGDPNFYSQIMLVIIPLSFSRFLGEKTPILKLIGLYGTCVSILTVVFTFSRGAFVALLLMTALMFYFHPPKPREFLISLFVVILLTPYIPAQYRDRILTLDSLTADHARRGEVSFRGRTSENLAAWMMFADNPILGVGAQNYNTNYQKYSRQIGIDPRSEARSAHSLYLEVAAELGLVGLAILGLILLALYRSITRSWKALQKLGDTYTSELVLSIGLALSGYFFAATFIHDAYPRYFWLLAGIGLSITEVTRRATENKADEAFAQTAESE
jgi:putative inorganic carbon (hco3(-)) transporter